MNITQLCPRNKFQFQCLSLKTKHNTQTSDRLSFRLSGLRLWRQVTEGGLSVWPAEMYRRSVAVDCFLGLSQHYRGYGDISPQSGLSRHQRQMTDTQTGCQFHYSTLVTIRRQLSSYQSCTNVSDLNPVK